MLCFVYTQLQMLQNAEKIETQVEEHSYAINRKSASMKFTED